MQRVDYLFQGGELTVWLDQAKAAMNDEIASTPEDYLLNVDLDDWVAHLVSKHRIEPLALQRDDYYLEDLGEQQIYLGGDPSRDVRVFYGANPTVPGRVATLHFPFVGDTTLIQLRPNTFTYNPPRAVVNGQEIVVRREWTEGSRPDLKAEAERFADTIQGWMTWSTEAVDAHNNELEPRAREAIQRRRERVLADRAHLDHLGIPVRRRGDAPTTYAAPEVVPRPSPAPAAKVPAPKAPEPTFVRELYEHTLTLIRSWSNAIERTPAPYRDASEETLRDALLPMPNSHYEGGATGETFNAAGKTDVLIRVEDRTIFIGECKWWSGPAGFEEALAQLFSYTTWRDSKLALIFFVDRKDPMAVIEKVRELLGDHELFIEWRELEQERELRCVMRWPGDAEITA